MNDVSADKTISVGGSSSSNLILSLLRISEQLYDIKNIVSYLTVICVLGGYVWNFGYFYVINYDFMKILTFSDYITTITSQIPFVVFAVAYIALFSIISDNINRLSQKIPGID
jgi:hypothetical protein